MRFALLTLVGAVLFLMTGCNSMLTPELTSTMATSDSSEMAKKISPESLMAPLAKQPISGEVLVGDWSGLIEWKTRKPHPSQSSLVTPSGVQEISNLWSLQLSITQQKLDHGELLLQGRATIHVGGASPSGTRPSFGFGFGSFFFSGFVVVRIIRKVIIFRFFLDDGPILIIKKCRIVFIFQSFFSSSLLAGQSRLFSCSDVFPDLTSLGFVTLGRAAPTQLSEPTARK
ncbi:hypothetical protein HY230_09845 [Candidatus Acetothermia bacterium]|nr:hypothetical protein [Candidatus Acetothermia bacterium]